jgi:hypothetical protein
MQPSNLDALLATPTFAADEVVKEANEIGIPAAGFESNNEYLADMVSLLKRISAQLEYQQPDDLDSPIQLTAVIALTLSKRGRKYTNVLLGGNSNQALSIFVPGVGNYPVSLAPGWNTIGAPDRSDITLGAMATQNPLPLLLRYSNTQYGTVIL